MTGLRGVFRGGGSAALLGSIVLCPACTVGPDYTAPPDDTPPEFASLALDQPGPSKLTGSSPDPVRWWSTLNDPALDALIERAAASNLDLRIAEARIREARAQRGIVASDGVPTLDAAGSYSRSRSSENTFQGAARNEDSLGSDLFQLGFDARWELDVFGGVRRATEAADAQIASAEESRRDVLVTLLAEVARNYTEARAFQRRAAIVERGIAVQQETLDLTRSRQQAGLVSELDVAQSRAQLESRRAQLPGLRAGFAQASHRLAVLLGQAPGVVQNELRDVVPIPSAPPQIPVGLPSDLLRRRPDVRRAEREIAAATARVGAATADLFPKFSLTGALGLQSQRFGDLFDLDSRYWSIVPGVRWPVFDAGRIRANIGVQNARLEQAALQYSRTVLTSLEDAENALTAFVHEQSRRQSLADAVDANRRALQLADELYRGGLTTFLNVLDTQQRLFEAEDQLAQSDRSVTTGCIAVYKALGGGWETFEP